MYLFLFVLFRVVVKRRVGNRPTFLVGTIVGWNTLIDWLTFRFEWLQKVLEPPPLLLIDNGRVLHRHLRQEFMSEADLKKT